MKIAITGALGHIGSRLLRFLPEDFSLEKMLFIDNMSCQRYCSLFNLPTGVPYHFMELDVASGNLTGLFAGYDVVIHLAAITNAAASFDQKDEVERNNFKATKNVAEACSAVGAKMIYISTTSVYGSQKIWVDEDCAIEDLQPQSPYATTKLQEEDFLRQLKQENPGFRYIACRFGTIFGTSPGMRFHTAVNKFCWQAINGQSLTVWRTALDQMRPYLDIEDAVRAVSHIIQNDLFDGEIYNVLTSNETVNRIINEIRRSVPDVQVKLVDTAIMNQLSYKVANKKFIATGFTFQGSIERGIADTLRLLQGIATGRAKSKTGSVPQEAFIS